MKSFLGNVPGVVHPRQPNREQRNPVRIDHQLFGIDQLDNCPDRSLQRHVELFDNLFGKVKPEATADRQRNQTFNQHPTELFQMLPKAHPALFKKIFDQDSVGNSFDGQGYFCS